MSSTKLSTFEILDRMNLMVSSAKTFPLSNRLMLDREELSALLRRLEDSIPNDLQQARKLLAVEQQIIDESRRQADSAMKEAGESAKQTVEKANNQANATLADAQAEAQEMLESAHRECEEYSMRVHGSVSQMLEQADDGLARQLDALRALRQEISAN